jgi:hypothetical protein
MLGALLYASNAGAQSVEVTPFGGLRFGSGVSAIGGAPVVDDDGGASFGAVVNIELGPPDDGRKFEALFSRASARVSIQPTFFSPPVQAISTVDHMMVGLVQELDSSRQRPFLSGLVGLTRYAAAGEMELLLTIGLGAGGKFLLTRHVGLRLDARGYMTIVDLGGVAICSGGCVFAFRANPVFQADLTAGIMISF